MAHFRIGAEAIRNYRRLSYTAWHAIAEFIDNSTQAYFDNCDVLDKIYRQQNTRLQVSVVYDRTANTLSVNDNSIGMNPEEVEVALEVAGHAPRSGGRSKYGMGLKTAACWFGNKWRLKTKKLGDTRECTVLVDVDRIASGETELESRVLDVGDSHRSYTELTIYELHRKLPGRTLGKIKRFLSSMYRYDLREGVMDLYWQGAPIEWEGIEDRILKAADGTPYRKVLDFIVLGHPVHGWVAVLGSGSREYAGFTLLQNKRVVRGYPDSWRPATLFGQIQGSNDLVNQRLVGELHLDTFEVSHTKDDIIWVGAEEEALEDMLLELCRDYKTVAGTPYRGMDERQPKTEVVDAAVDQLFKDLSSSEIVDTIEITDAPPEEIVDETFHAVVHQEAKSDPRIDLQVGRTRVKLHLSYSASFNDPYVAIDLTPDEMVIVVVNMNHPYVNFLDDASSMTGYLRQCVFDAIATNMARIQKGKVHYNTVQLHKDRLLRIPHSLHDLVPDDRDEDPV